MSELSKLERYRKEAWNEVQEYKQDVAIRRSKLELAESDERAAKQRLDDLNAQLAKEQEKELAKEQEKEAIVSTLNKQILAEEKERAATQKVIIDKFGHEFVGGMVNKWCPTCTFVSNQGVCFKKLLPISTDGQEGICYIPLTGGQ